MQHVCSDIDEFVAHQFPAEDVVNGKGAALPQAPQDTTDDRVGLQSVLSSVQSVL